MGNDIYPRIKWCDAQENQPQPIASQATEWNIQNTKEPDKRKVDLKVIYPDTNNFISNEQDKVKVKNQSFIISDLKIFF